MPCQSQVCILVAQEPKASGNRVDGDGAGIARDGFIQLLAFLERVAPREPGFGMGGVEFDRLVVAGDGLLQAVEFLQGHAGIGPGVG